MLAIEYTPIVPDTKIKTVVKRDGRMVPFSDGYIKNAISKAIAETPTTNRVGAMRNPERLTERVVKTLEALYDSRAVVSIEMIQDAVETVLKSSGEETVAKNYAAYRLKRAEEREAREVPEYVKQLYLDSAKYFPEPIQQFQFFDKYSSFNHEENRREVWTETVERTMQELHNLSGGKVDVLTMSEIHQAILKLEVMPSMRMLAMAGKGLNHIGFYNCFSGNTELLTYKGKMTLLEASRLGTVQVLNKNSLWATAEVKSFGEQHLNKIKLTHWNGGKHGNVENEILVTPNHRWILLDGTETTDLKIGDKLFSPEINIEPSLEGIRHGIVFGDGTLNRQNGTDYTQIRLCGQKNKLLKYFENEFTYSYLPSYNGDAVVYCGKAKSYYKSLPDLGIITPEYIAGFIEGLFLTDGHKNSCGNIRLDTQDLRLVEWLNKFAPLAGFKILSDRSYNTITNHRQRTNPLHQVLIGKGENAVLKVSSIEYYGFEEVYCAIENSTHTFTLGNGQVTGNCSFVAVDSLDAFVEALIISMAGCGVGFSVEHQFVSQLPRIKRHTTRSSNFIHIIDDSAEGWADALRFGLETWFNGDDVQFDYSKIRAAGSVLKRKGGRACLTGDTIVYKDRKKSSKQNTITIKELYDKTINTPNRVKLIKLRSVDEQTKSIHRNKLTGVVYNGIAPVYQITTELGYKIKATSNHRFVNEKYDYQTVDKFSVGDRIAVNGVELKTKNCLDCGTLISRRAIRCKSCFDVIQTKSNALETTARQRKPVKEYKLSHSICEKCSIENPVKAEVHHLDKNPLNNDESNLLFLCEQCHYQVHATESVYGNPYSQKYVSMDTIISIEYVGEEPVFDLQMQAPNHNFIANGFVSHNSGPEPFKNTLDAIRKIIMRSRTGLLTSLNCHDIMCHIGSAAVSGGVRRTAMISLFDFDDEDMLNSKSLGFDIENSQRWNANNSAVWPERELTKLEVLDFMNKMYKSGNGEPGIFSRKSAKDYMPTRRNKDFEFGTNPCLTADTRIFTSIGVKTISELIGKKFNPVINGKKLEFESDGFFYTGDKPVYKIQTKEGFSIKATDNHKFMNSDGNWIEVKNLKPSDKLKLSQHGEAILAEKNTESKMGWLLGSLVGDGTFENSETVRLEYWGDNQEVMSKIASDNLLEAFGEIATIRKTESKTSVVSKELAKLALHFGIIKGNKHFIENIEFASPEIKIGFLSGIFDADGTVSFNPTKGSSVRLNQSNFQLLESVQRMLITFGIKGTIYTNRKPEGYKMLPDGNGNLKEYFCQTNHNLIISRAGIEIFNEKIGFEETAKQSLLESICNSRNRMPYVQDMTAEIESIEYIGIEPVYDCTVPVVHNFDANGFVSHNCGEIVLRPMEFCNLSAVVARPFDTEETLMEKVRLATIIGTIQSTAVNFEGLRPEWRKNCEEERLLGVDITGQMDCNLLNKMEGDRGYEDSEVLRRKLRLYAVKVNKEFAELLGIPQSASVTCVKPSGNTSQLVNCSSGLHPRWSEYYIRRVRLDAKSPVYKVLVDAGVPLVPENGQTVENARTWVAEFPVKSPGGAIVREDTTAYLQSEFWKLNKIFWTEHNPSVTVNYKMNEITELVDWVFDNQDVIGGMAFLPFYEESVTMSLLPYESITEEEYEKRKESFPKKIDFSRLYAYEYADTTESAALLACMSPGQDC